MADFHQPGEITTLHRLGPGDLTRLERELAGFAAARPLALILPCLALELRESGLKRVVDALRGVSYLGEVVVCVSGARDRDEVAAVGQAFEGVTAQDGRPATILWSDGPEVSALCDRLRAEGFPVERFGKGQSVWLAIGYVLARGRAHAIAAHDCDIRDYRRELLARLVYPVMSPQLDYAFAKGFYPRFSERLYGRVTRLFLTPLLRALSAVLGPHELLQFLGAFRYALAGEIAMNADLARKTRIPNDWGLEVATLAEVYRSCAPARVCQVELADNYDHRHRELSPDDATQGLHRMVIDITAALIRNLASYGVEFDAGFLNTLLVTYVRTAQDAVRRHGDDAALNGLAFDAHNEELAVETFSGALRTAGLEFVRDPLGAPPLPHWSRVEAALPGFLGELRAVVDR